VLQCVAVCCRVLQCQCIQYTSLWFFCVLQCVAACCSVLQCVAVSMYTIYKSLILLFYDQIRANYSDLPFIDVSRVMCVTHVCQTYTLCVSRVYRILPLTNRTHTHTHTHTHTYTHTMANTSSRAIDTQVLCNCVSAHACLTHTCHTHT